MDVKEVWGCRLDWSEFGYGSLMGCCEHSKDRLFPECNLEFCEYPTEYWLLKKGLAAWREFVSGHNFHMHNIPTLTFYTLGVVFVTWLKTCHLLLLATKKK
jgi:hypothetical protein